MGVQIVPSPVPHTKFAKINEIHEKGDRGEGQIDDRSINLREWVISQY